MSDNTIPATVLLQEGKIRTAISLDLIREEPLSIRVQGRPYAVVMRTPGDEQAHVAGFCLGEGIVDSPDDIANHCVLRGRGHERGDPHRQSDPLDGHHRRAGTPGLCQPDELRHLRQGTG